MHAKLIALGLLAMLGGCSGPLGLDDPFQRQGTWAATGVNDANLRAMVVDPVDLQHGSGATDSIGVTATSAVVRMRTDNIKNLPDTNLSGIGPSGSANGGGGGAVTQ
jgi:hypothetical protein